MGLLLAAAVATTGCKKDEDKGAGAPAAEDTPPATQTPPVQPEEQTAEQPPAGEAGGTATATLQPAKDKKVSGTVTFTEKDGSVEVAVDIQGLTPGPHGFHVHEKGDCSAPDFSSAGGHFNPQGHPHGPPDAPADKRHAGDFGNLTADESGNAKTTLTMEGVTLAEGESSVVGKAVVVHEKADDLKSQPSGDAGGRVACGVIEKK